MALNNVKPGFNNAAEFTASGLPWVLSGTVSNSVVKYSFPKVTKDIVIINNNTTAAQRLRVGFTENGVNGVGNAYYILVNGGSNITLNVRVKELYLLRDGGSDISTSVCANLTTIDSMMMPVLTGSLGGTTYWEGVG
jgi:hypothetical protein